MQIGDINVVESIINTEIRLGTLERILDYILTNNFSLTKPTPADIQKYRDQVLVELQSRYPNMGIQKK